MKKSFCLVLALLLPLALIAAQAGSKPSAAPKAAAATTPGTEIAQVITTVTGVAISPMLGVSAFGAWTYFKTPAENRARLPWYAQPWFWVSGLVLVGAVFLKDAGGTVVPTALKKPLDVAEAIENKVSGLVAAGAFVPLVASVFGAESVRAAVPADGMFASLAVSGFFNVLMVPLAMAAFAVVFLVSHAINMLILISPFATVDAALKSFRMFLLGTVTVAGFADPTVGAVWSVIIIIICYFLAGWAFRLTVCGSQFIWDYLTFGRTRFEPQAGGNAMFLARAIGPAPIRSYGRLARDAQGNLSFTYRPWLVLAARTVSLPAASYAVGRGFLHGEIVRQQDGDQHAVFTLPPRYNTHEAALAKAYGWGEVVDVGLLGGLKAIGRAVRELCGIKPAPAAAG